ncbi:hypothetical protein WCT96_13685 [Pectobacterium carotovorum]|uniref:hypothetical protein n=1 Tax=Pectobacterium carotovorum TaxID=554 RepID=UPI003017DEA7
MFPACRSDDSDFHKFIGQKIKSGTMRDVYEVDGYPDFIIKEDRTTNHGANETEAAVYFTAIINKFQAVLECIAEIRSISQSGKYLIMEKLNTNIPNELRPCGNMPNEVTDNKLENFGVSLKNNKIKCLDYAQLSDNHKPGEISGRVRSANLPSVEGVTDMRKDMDSINDILNDFDQESNFPPY